MVVCLALFLIHDDFLKMFSPLVGRLVLNSQKRFKIGEMK